MQSGRKVKVGKGPKQGQKKNIIFWVMLEFYIANEWDPFSKNNLKGANMEF